MGGVSGGGTEEYTNTRLQKYKELTNTKLSLLYTQIHDYKKELTNTKQNLLDKVVIEEVGEENTQKHDYKNI